MEIINNTIHSVGLSKRGDGMYIAGDNHIIRGNTIYDAYGYGIQVYSEGGPVPDNVLIEQNRFYNNGREDYGEGYPTHDRPTGDGIYAMGTGHVIKNNIVHGNHMYGIRLSGWSIASKVYNNTIYNNGQQGLYVSSGPSLIKNNISYLNGLVDYFGDGITASNNLSTDPSFVDVANYNFQLSEQSMARDAGVTLAEVNTDFNGISRPQGNGYDIGAYEFTGGGNRSM